MKIAVPTAGGRLCPHFGHCEKFALFEVEGGRITNRSDVEPPPHEPGVLPRWLAETAGVNLILAGGMGVRARRLLAGKGIETIVGAPAEEAEQVVKAYLAGTLETGDNHCDH